MKKAFKKIFKTHSRKHSEEAKEAMAYPSTSNANDVSHSEEFKEGSKKSRDNLAANLILNHDFSNGLDSWHPNCCEGYVASNSGYPQNISASPGNYYAVITNRKECWQGLEQDITTRVSPGLTYTVSATVSVSGPLQDIADVSATLRLEYRNAATSYLFIARTSVSKDGWEKLEGTFLLSDMPDQVVLYFEGPSPGVDLLIKSVSVFSPSEFRTGSIEYVSGGKEITLNPEFDDGIQCWSGRGCKIVLHNSMVDGKILPASGKCFASARERTATWHGIEQDITARVCRKLAYEVSATVRIFGNNVSNADVRATLFVQTSDRREEYIGIANAQATDKDWVQLRGKFLLNGFFSKVVIYLEGPPPGTDILLNNFVVQRAERRPPLLAKVSERVDYGANIMTNSNLGNGTNGWFPLGNCTLSTGIGSPNTFPPMARATLGPCEPLSGRFIIVSNRTQTWMGPAQIITDKIELYRTYQVSAWVRIGSNAAGPQNVNVAVGVDSQWVNGGQVEINDQRWHEVCGSFRIETKPTKVMVYVQGPVAGVDLMVAGMHIFPVNRHARFRHLKDQTDKIRKHDVVLKFSRSDSVSTQGIPVKVRQVHNSFPFGSCVSRSNIDNEDFVDFFKQHFNWAVFGNELKWYWTESEQGKINYKDADDLLNFCASHNIETRGHCIFWEVEDTVQPWIRALNENNLMAAVQNRLTSLLTRYKGKFRHYDVNNEMLHGSFFEDRLGKDIRTNMFKKANQLDPSAMLFVNDYHVEDGCDSKSSPEKYIQQILDLQEQGAPVGGIGIQGHIDYPVGSIVCSALDKLAILGLPIWFTELDVSSSNEHVRADDLEVMLREAFAHPAVDGVMLWGFWELFMCRDHSHLVNAEGEINEAGKRYLALKQEWMSNAQGHIDEQGQFGFRGFYGTYEVEVDISHSKKKIIKPFVVEKGESPLVLSIDL
ncbi:hypothetical protein DCAR_0310782 [Daucus carota subsp. sativus]|uniref:GH10 domain-containing protein n=1 Tax=Daucus carota subsp. sativus TaxID=79200 RepID=A0AAF0WN85_DAUCS|nr:hypothetical protein DCAR_0310782 [Daucus carota subsp. sativus]